MQIFWQENITGHPGEGGGVKHGTFRKSGLFFNRRGPLYRSQTKGYAAIPKKNQLHVAGGRGRFCKFVNVLSLIHYPVAETTVVEILKYIFLLLGD